MISSAKLIYIKSTGISAGEADSIVGGGLSGVATDRVVGRSADGVAAGRFDTSFVLTSRYTSC